MNKRRRKGDAATQADNQHVARIRMEQEGREPVTLERKDFAIYSSNALIVRAPKGLRPGTVRVSIENRGAAGYSAPVVKTFELSARP